MKKFELTLPEIKAFSNYFGLITHPEKNCWRWEIVGAPLPPEEIRETPDCATAIINCESYVGGAYLIVAETTPGKYQLVRNKLRQEYLNGLTTAAQALHGAFLDKQFNDALQVDKNTNALEKVFKKIIAQRGYRAVPPSQKIKTYGARYIGKHHPIARKFTLEEVKSLARIIGVIWSKNDYWQSKIIPISSGRGYLQTAREHQLITTGDGSKASALAAAKAYDPTLIIRPTGKSLYHIEENYQPEEFLKGLVQGYHVIQGIFNSWPVNNYHRALKIALQALKEMVNDSRQELGYAKIKNADHYHEFNIMRWRKDSPASGWQNSR